jgi:hypothetical protein
MAPAETACVVDKKKAPEAPGLLVSVKWASGPRPVFERPARRSIPYFGVGINHGMRRHENNNPSGMFTWIPPQ